MSALSVPPQILSTLGDTPVTGRPTFEAIGIIK